MRALRYFFVEAAASLWRGRAAALLAVVTIAVGLFVLGFFLLVNANLQQVVSRWSESAELSIYLDDEATAEQLKEIAEMADRSGMIAQRDYVSREASARAIQVGLPGPRLHRRRAAGAIRSQPPSRSA